MSFVALDIATHCGVACWKTGTPAPLLETLKLSGDASELGIPMEKLRKKLNEIHSDDRIEILFIEAPILPKTTTIYTVRKLNSLIAMADWWAYKLKIECREVDQGKWRSHFIGQGNGKSAVLKQMAKERCEFLGWDHHNDDNCADAAGQLSYGLACFNVDVPWRDHSLFGGALK